MAMDATDTTLEAGKDVANVDLGTTGQQDSIEERGVAVPKSTSAPSHATSKAPSVQGTETEINPWADIESDEELEAARPLPPQRLGGTTLTDSTTSLSYTDQTYVSNLTTFKRAIDSLTQHNVAPTQTAESTATQAPGNSSPHAHRVNLREFVQTLDAVDLDPDDIETFVAIPYEPITCSEKQGEQLPRKPSSATRPFILRRFSEALKNARRTSHTETKTFADRYDYVKKYPQDAPEEAMGPNARVWHVYLDEVEQFDIDMVDNFRDTVDVLLVFAGLFSAVVTTFVAQASTALQTDYNQVTASAALEQLAIQRAYYSGLPIPEPSSSTLGLDSSTTTTSDRWVNGLWFTSLSFSLVTALFAVLVKQWIQAYVSPVSGSIQTRVRVRQYRYLGLERWHVYGIIGLLPTLLHLSLFLFLAGLAVFLFALDSTIATVTTTIAGSVATIYISSTLAPAFNSQCPYKTPLSTYALSLLYPLLTRFMSVTRFDRESDFEEKTEASSITSHTTASSFMKKVELNDIELISDAIDAEALCWVIDRSSNPSVRTVVFEAVCDLPLGFKARHILRNGDVGRAACASLEACTSWVQGWDRTLKHVQPRLEDSHFRSSLVHFQLGWCFFPRPGDVHMNEGTARHVPCIYHPSYAAAESPSHRDPDGRLGPYFSLLLGPSWELVRPQHILQSLPPNPPRIVFLHTLRRAALYLQSYPSSRYQDDMIDWPSCQKLFALVQLWPPPGDLFGLWQTTLVSVYLASLVPGAAPISEGSGLLHNLLFNQIELGSSQLSEDEAINLSLQSCMEFFAHTLKTPTASTDFSSSSHVKKFIKHLSAHFDKHRSWVSYSTKNVIGPHHTVLVALLDHSEKHSALISADLRTLMYKLGRNMMQRQKSQASDPELDLAPLLRRLLRAALIPPRLSKTYKLLEPRIDCLYTVLRGSPVDSHTILTEIFRAYDGITTLEQIIQRAGYGLDGFDIARIEFSLEFYLKQVSPDGKKRMPSPVTDISHHGRQSDANSQDHVGYILQHLKQVVRIFVACHYGEISRLEAYSYPDTLHVLRRIVKTQHESTEWDRALQELGTQSLELPVSEYLSDYVEHNMQEIVSILKSDLAAVRPPSTQDSLQPERPLSPWSESSIHIPEATRTVFYPTLETIIEEESHYSIRHEESIVSRSTRRFRAAVLGVMAARRVAAGAILPLHYRTPLEHAQEHGPRNSAE